MEISNIKLSTFRLIKTGADGTPLDGVTFRIAWIEDGSHYLDRTTQNGGEIVIEGLEPGVYSVTETATLPSYILDKTEHHVELFPGKTSEIRLNNDKRPTLVISKTDKDTGKPVPGVTFTLRGADGPTITTKPTGADGKIVIENLLPGVYTITEQSVPENYILDTTPQTVTLLANREAQVEFNGDKQERKNHGRDGKGQGQNQRPAGPAERAGAETQGGRERGDCGHRAGHEHFP